MAASDAAVRERLHQLVDELAGGELERAEAALSRLREARAGAPRSKREPTLHRAMGMAATDRPPPTDEEVDRWLEEERVKKYG